jgi:hypothetical protein
MVSSVMLRLVALVRADVSEETSASFIMVTRNRELGTTLAATNNRLTLEALVSSEKLALTRATRCNISEGTILHSHRLENLKSYTLAVDRFICGGSCKSVDTTSSLQIISLQLSE